MDSSYFHTSALGINTLCGVFKDTTHNQFGGTQSSVCHSLKCSSTVNQLHLPICAPLYCSTHFQLSLEVLATTKKETSCQFVPVPVFCFHAKHASINIDLMCSIFHTISVAILQSMVWSQMYETMKTNSLFHH